MVISVLVTGARVSDTMHQLPRRALATRLSNRLRCACCKREFRELPLHGTHVDGRQSRDRRSLREAQQVPPDFWMILPRGANCVVMLLGEPLDSVNT